MKTKVFSLILIALIVTSSLGMANAEFGIFGLPDAKKTEITTTPAQKIVTVSTSHQPAKIEVDLSESVGITTNDNLNNNQAQNEIPNSVNKLSLVKTEINLSENLGIYDNLPGKNAFLVLKQSSDTVTTMERISNLDRIRFSGRSIVVNDGLSSDSKIYAGLVTLVENPELSLAKVNHNIENNLGKINDDISHYIIPVTISVEQKSAYKFSGEIIAVKNFVLATTHDSVHGKNPTIFLLLVPLSGYILIRAEGGRLRFSNTKQILSFCFIAILISSMVVSPLSVYPGYLQYAAAESSNNSTSLQNSTSKNSTLLFGYSNSTSLQNSTSKNSTLLFGYSNSTSLQNSTSKNSTNVTNPVSSFQFNSSLLNKTGVGDIETDNSTNVTSLELTGSGYLKQNVNSTANISNLTMSAWVKPDYSQGSSQFTVISKENVFALAINNNMPPSKKAVFSIFDGIKWNTIQSKSDIPDQEWTLLAATYNGSSISLYINGTLESQSSLSGIPTLQLNGLLATKTVSNLTSNADIVIGAYLDATRSSSSNLFSGLLNNVNLYDVVLTQQQIAKMYTESSLGNDVNTPLPLTSNSTIIKHLVLPNATNSTGVKSTNSTVLNFNSYSNSTLVANSTIPSNSTLFAIGNGTMGGLFLKHDKILLNQPVTWVQNVTLTNQTQDMAIEIPADAQIVHLDVIHDKKLENLFDSSNNISSGFAASQKQSINGIGISNNIDVKQKHLNKLQILNQTIRQKLNLHNQNLSVTAGNQSTPLISLSQLPQVLQNNKPTKVLLVNESASKYDITYVTPAPFTVEKDVSSASKYDKMVWVAHNSTLHYTNVTAFSNISEDLAKQGAHFKLYWMINGSSVDVTNDPRFAVKLVDTNGNGIPDQMQWTVPRLSQQQFQITAQLSVINVQSYPAVGGNWTVYFNTTGTADLNITAINGTTFGSAAPADLKFLQLNNGTTTLSPTIQGNSIIYHNYSSNDEGFETSHVMTFGHHHLMFQFGNSTAYANNNAYISQISVHTPLGVFIDSSGNFNIGSAIDYASQVGPGGGTPLFNVTSTAAFGVAARSGLVYVADTNNNQIDVYSSSGSLQSSFGSSTLLSPTGVTVDSSGNIYVADTGNDLVKKFSSSGTLLTTFGSGTGTSLGQFTGPMGVAVNSTGYVYVTDTGNDRVEIFDSSGTAKSSFGTTGSSTGQFNSPIGITIDNFNNVYVADTQNDRIEKFSPTGTFLQSFGFFGTAGNQFDGPVGVAVDSNNGIYVADSNNDRISKFNPDDVGLTENLGLTDRITKTVTVHLSDSLTLSDSAASSHNIIQLLSEPLNLNDGTVSGQLVHVVSLSEQLTLSDTATTTHSFTQPLLESLALSDTATKSITSHLSESLPLSDGTVNGQLSHVTSLSESLSLTDTATKSIIHQLSETFGLNDGATSAVNLSPTQQLVGQLTTQLTVDPSQPQLVITSNNNALSNVVVPSTVSTPTINYSTIITSGAVQIPATNWLNVTKFTDANTQPTVSISIQPSTTILGGTLWNGVLQLPTIISPPPNLSIPVSTGQTITTHTVLLVGSSVPLRFDSPVRILLAGQAGSDAGYYYDPTDVKLITNACTTDSSSGISATEPECKIDVGSDLVIWTRHFTGFATWSSSSSPGSSSPATSVGNGGAAGSVGAGPSASSSSTGESSVGFGGVLAPELKIDNISYDVCQSDTVKILVEYSDNNPSVILRTSLSGVVQTQLAKDQPFAQENVNSTIQKIVYEAPINPKEQSFEVVALQAVDNNVNSVGQTVDITGCQESLNFENEQQVEPNSIDESAPKIFDVKLQSGNGTVMSENNYLGSQSVTVSAIISSPTPLDKAEIRFANTGQSGNIYNSATMTVAPLLISNTTYTVTGTIPQEMLASPATTYWVDVHNTAQKTTDSDKYTVAVKPSYPVLGNLTMDIVPTRAAGTMESATAYFTNNSTGPVYGSVSLVVDGKISYTSPPQLFVTGQTPVNLEWQVPIDNAIKDYQVNAVANFYGQSFTTETSPVTSFQSIRTVAISTPVDIETLQENNNTVAKPAVLYSSFKNEGTMRYHVTAPDGTCVIGGSSDCLVTKSTFGLRGDFKIVTIGDQTYLVRYSGPDSPLERFSITSIDPIVGQWKVGIDSQDSLLPQAQAANDVFMKIKYAADSTVETLESQ